MEAIQIYDEQMATEGHAHNIFSLSNMLARRSWRWRGSNAASMELVPSRDTELVSPIAPCRSAVAGMVRKMLRMKCRSVRVVGESSAFVIRAMVSVKFRLSVSASS